MKKPNVVGTVILAGGESLRMGTPKALLPMPNFPNLLAFHIHHASLLNLPILVADNGKNFGQTANCSHLFNVSDFIPSDSHKNRPQKQGNGALAAMAGAMDVLYTSPSWQTLSPQNAYILVISSDSLLRADLVFETLKIPTHADVVYFKGKKDYPLLGLYRLGILPVLKQYLNNGDRAVMRFLSQIPCETVRLPQPWQDLANVNTRDEFTQALDTYIHSFPQ